MVLILIVVEKLGYSQKSVVIFHNGSRSQEAIFVDVKNDAGLNLIPSRRLSGNQIFTLCSLMAHNLSREVQMIAASPSIGALPKRPAGWTFQRLDTPRHRIIKRAGRLTKPKGELTLKMRANHAVRRNILHFLEKLQEAA